MMRIRIGWLLVVAGAAQGACGPAAPEANSPADDVALLEDDSAAAAPASSDKVKRGVDLISAEDFQAAREVLEEAAAEDPKDPQAAFYLGVALGALGETEPALATLRRALSLQENFPEASLNLSALLLESGKLDEALAAAEQGLKGAPNDKGLLQNRALALLDLGQADEAAKAFARVVEKMPDNDEMRFLYAQSLQQSGADEESRVQLKKLESSESVAVLASVADVYGRLKAWPECVATLDRALGKDDASELHVKRGLCLHGAGDEDAARGAFEKAIALDSQSAKAYFYLGHNLRARGDKPGAKKAFLKASELGAGDKIGEAAKAAASKL